MRILLIYPETPSTFWSFTNALHFVSKRSSNIPLGLLTVAALLPESWEKKLIDLNVEPLTDKQILWADYVFITGMNIHIRSFQHIVRRCNTLGVKVVAGGPMVTANHSEFLGVDHFILNEAEATLPPFIADLEKGIPKHVYKTDQFPDLSQTPSPAWNLLKMKKYAGMSIQYSRGCPFNCEFCSIAMLNGHRPRTKSENQFIAELEALYQQHWRGSVFIVDDNFIGNKRKLKTEILPAMAAWSAAHGNPFEFITEASINLADDDELVDMMVDAGFQSTFIGIETPNSDSLTECGKSQNLKRDMSGAVKRLQQRGLEVYGGFIVGFDSDPPTIFRQMIDFIQKSGIVTAMVGLLNAPTGSRLFQRLRTENRLLNVMSGDNMDGSMNFIPKMDYQKLIAGYKDVLTTIYSQRAYYERIKTFLREYHPPTITAPKLSFQDIMAFLKSIWKIGLLEKGKRYYWKLVFLSLFRYPDKFALSIKLAIYGFHFRRVVNSI